MKEQAHQIESRGYELNTDREDVLTLVRARRHFMFTGTTHGNRYAMAVTPSQEHSGYDVDLTVTYSDGTIRDRYLRTYPCNMDAQQIRRNMLRFLFG